MPLIDVSDLMTDPDFCEQVTVIRRVQTVGANGVGVLTPTSFPITAVVTAIAGDMVRQPDSEYQRNDIMVHSKTRLLGVAATTIPDIVVWGGNNYIVKRSNNWSHFGAGFTAAICSLTDVVIAS